MIEIVSSTQGVESECLWYDTELIALGVGHNEKAALVVSAQASTTKCLDFGLDFGDVRAGYVDVDSVLVSLGFFDLLEPQTHTAC